MKNVVVDASVVIKWIFPNQPGEEHVSQAVYLLQAIQHGSIKACQPVHWIAEASAVVVRLNSKIANEVVTLLSSMELAVIDYPEVYHLACRLSHEFKHHVFDTLYHAVALLHGNTQLVTADMQYYKKSRRQGSIIHLADYSIFDN